MCAGAVPHWNAVGLHEVDDASVRLSRVVPEHAIELHIRARVPRDV